VMADHGGLLDSSSSSPGLPLFRPPLCEAPRVPAARPRGGSVNFYASKGSIQLLRARLPHYFLFSFTSPAIPD
jgi:hypothetical protein